MLEKLQSTRHVARVVLVHSSLDMLVASAQLVPVRLSARHVGQDIHVDLCGDRRIGMLQSQQSRTESSSKCYA